MCLLSYCQRKFRMPRCLSEVTARSSVFPSVRIHTFNTPSTGARYPSCVPSGEICGSARSGLPKSTSRGIRGGVDFSCAATGRQLNHTQSNNPTTACLSRRITPPTFVSIVGENQPTAPCSAFLSQAKAFREQLGDCHLFDTGLTAEQDHSFRAEFEDDLTTCTAWGTGTVAFGGDGNGSDPHAASFGGDGGEDGVALGADGQ